MRFRSYKLCLHVDWRQLRALFLGVLISISADAQEETLDGTADDIVESLNEAAAASEEDGKDDGFKDESLPEMPSGGPTIRSAKHLYVDGQKRSEPVASEKMFGAYRIHIGAAKPTFDKQDEYEGFYDSTSYYPVFGVDYFFWDWYATLGLTMRIGFYKDDGHAAIRDSAGEFSEDKDSPIEFTMLPIQLGAIFEATPFPQKWIVLSGWSGLEYTYFEEVRVEESETSSDSDDDDSDNSDNSSSSDDDKPLVNSGRRYGTFFGGAAHFMLNAIDPKASDSLRVMGLRGIYLSPYFQLVSGFGGGVDFSRTELGLAFTFESI